MGAVYGTISWVSAESEDLGLSTEIITNMALHHGLKIVCEPKSYPGRHLDNLERRRRLTVEISGCKLFYMSRVGAIDKMNRFLQECDDHFVERASVQTYVY